MSTRSFEIATARLLLRPWRPSDSSDLARMNADTEVAADLGGPISADKSNQKMQNYVEAFRQHPIARWLVSDSENHFIGYCGIMPVGDNHPLGLPYTAADNIRSQNVMRRLGLERKPALDFNKHYEETGLWKGLVWACSAATRMNRANT